MITTSTSINVNKTIRLGTATAYSTSNVSLFITHDGIQKRFTATSVTNATTTSTGLVTFSAIPLWGDGGYSFYITAESSTDLDTSGVNLNKVATGFIKKITNVDTLNI